MVTGIHTFKDQDKYYSKNEQRKTKLEERKQLNRKNIVYIKFSYFII